MRRPRVTLVGALAWCVSPACSSPAPPQTLDGGGCVAVISSSDSSAPVSFVQAVMPLFQHSCALGGPSCHGDPGVTTSGRPYLGSPNGGTNAAIVLGQIVAVPSTEDRSMKLVAPGSAADSFLMHKLDGDQCLFASMCATSPFPDCGQPMPWGSGTIDVASRDAIRGWIEQGALNN